VKLFFDRAAAKTGIPEEYLKLIQACDTVIRFNIPLRRDNGTIETITCYRYSSIHHHFLFNNNTCIEPSTVITDSQSKVVLDTPSTWTSR
jgi:hypothetical protein